MNHIQEDTPHPSTKHALANVVHQSAESLRRLLDLDGPKDNLLTCHLLQEFSAPNPVRAEEVNSSSPREVYNLTCDDDNGVDFLFSVCIHWSFWIRCCIYIVFFIYIQILIVLLQHQ